MEKMKNFHYEEQLNTVVGNWLTHNCQDLTVRSFDFFQIKRNNYGETIVIEIRKH